VIAIKLNDELITRYAKKIMGFAYARARDVTAAEDLSQEILAQLTNALRRHEKIADLDGFVYTLCCYTWSNFVRANKKHWRNLDLSALAEQRSGEDIESDAERSDTAERLRREIAYLSALHRKITLRFWFDGRTGAEISRELGIPQSTVRWHIGEIKNKLKVGIEMADNLSYTPQKLVGGLDGSTTPEHNMAGMGEDRLVDNILIVCYGKPLTVEEIARKLSVAAAYLEYHIEELVFMDYLKVVEKNKYQTTFFISRERYSVMETLHINREIPPYAERIYNAFAERYERIRDIGFLGSDLDRDTVLWALLPLTISRLYYASLTAVLERAGSHLAYDFYPHRKDGSQHWVNTRIIDDDWYDTQTEFTAEEIAEHKNFKAAGVWQNSEDLGGGVKAYSVTVMGRGRMDLGIKLEFPNVVELARIAQIIRGGEEPNEYDKLIIANQVKLGYVSVTDGKPKMLIPFFSEEEYGRLTAILDEIAAELGEDMFVECIEGVGRLFEPEIPAFLSEDERLYVKTTRFSAVHYAILYMLENNGFLRSPTDDEAKCLCTVVWCAKTGNRWLA
jgi:RNA polymerase sigma factor (sigma-70 family)